MNPKTELLRSIYYDNLRIEGKCAAQEPQRSKRGRWAAHIRRLGIILLVVAASFIPELSLDEEAPEMTIAAASVENPDAPASPIPYGPPLDLVRIDSRFDAAGAAPEPSGFTKMQSESILETSLGNWTDYLARIQQTQDYSLLISGEDHIRLSSLFGLNIKKIVIDPGHGGRDPGAIGAKGTKEKNITLDVSLWIAEKLRRNGHVVLLTRETDSKLSPAQRVEFAKSNKADLFISVHVNSLPNQSLNIIETYYFGPPLNSEILRLAEQENKESHYTIGEIDAIIQDIGNTLKRQESVMLAGFIQESLFRNIRSHDEQVLDYGIKMAPFVVLSQIDVPSVLVEISCLTKEEEEEKLKSPQYREKIASFIEEGIASYLETQSSKILIGEKQ